MNIAEFYNKRAVECKETWDAAHWISKESQQDNFNLLTQIAPFEHTDKILDLGCGTGDLYGFFKRRGNKLVYEGIDVSPQMIKRAWQKYPEGRFACMDFLDEKFAFQYDWIFASGTFNHKVEGDQYQYLDKCLTKMFKQSKKGFGVILMSNMDPCQKKKPLEYLFGYDPIKVMEQCFALTPLVNLNHTALTWGFIVFCYNPVWLLA